MTLLVGLGNEGARYAETRHNVGRRLIEMLVNHYTMTKTSGKFPVSMFRGRIGETHVVAGFTHSFMNETGPGLAKYMRFMRIPTENLLVFHDDIDLPVGRMRYKVGGGAGGHRGLESIDRALGRTYARLRIGVGRPSSPEAAARYVLTKANETEQRQEAKLRTFVVEHVDKLLQDQPELFLQAWANRLQEKT